MRQKDFSLEEATRSLLEQVVPGEESETIDLLDAMGRVAFEDVKATSDHPPFDRSPLDGYAVRHEDIEGATRHAPVALRITETVYAGEIPEAKLGAGQAVQVATGAPLPLGATCVVRQEDTDVVGERVRVYVSHKKHENYCFQGEDMIKGQPLLTRGERINSAHVGILASQGVSQVTVYQKPPIGILSTGSELAAIGGPLAAGQIYDSNQYLFAARAVELGAKPRLGMSAPDDLHLIADQVLSLLEQSAFVVTTGGVSVGERDYMAQVGEIIGAARLFHGVSVKPGGSLLALEKEGKIVLCLSGNPFAAAATFELLAAPVLRTLAGNAHPFPKRVWGVLKDSFPKASKRRRIIRACIKGADISIPKQGHSSGVLSTFKDCNCLLDIPAGTPPLFVGQLMEAILL